MTYDDKSNYIRVRALISGRVQHVGFRYWACENAERLGLTGSVENLPDGRVEAVFQGLPECVNEMKEKLKRGPSMAIVNAKKLRTMKHISPPCIKLYSCMCYYFS